MKFGRFDGKCATIPPLANNDEELLPVDMEIVFEQGSRDWTKRDGVTSVVLCHLARRSLTEQSRMEPKSHFAHNFAVKR
jgi:hypothetical protein